MNEILREIDGLVLHIREPRKGKIQYMHPELQGIHGEEKTGTLWHDLRESGFR